MRSLPPNVLRELRQLVVEYGGEPSAWTLPHIDRALAPRRSTNLAKARRAVKKQTRKEKVAAIREVVMVRADGVCECGCGHQNARSMDHFFGGSGRRKQLESVETCWALTSTCHILKTHNKYGPAWWLERFSAHADRHGYTKAASMARARLEALTIQGRT